MNVDKRELANIMRRAEQIKKQVHRQNQEGQRQPKDYDAPLVFEQPSSALAEANEEIKQDNSQR